MPPPLSVDRLTRKEVSLGVIREIIPPESHIGLSIAPWLSVQSDDVIFDYAKGLTDGLAPARAEDAESELAQKDDTYVGQGRAAVIDWALKDRYSASDVTRYREILRIAEEVRDTNSLPLTVDSMLEDFSTKLARDTARRARKLYNRIEWMIMTSLESGGMSYTGGGIKFTVDYGRPAAQQTHATAANPAFYAGGAANLAGSIFWGTTNSDPIADILRVQNYMYDTHGVRITRAITSRAVLTAIINSDKFIARTGMTGTGVDPRYLIDGWGPKAAQQVVEQQTGLTFIEYDSVYRTRPVGSNTVTNNRFTNQKYVIFLPDEGDVAEISDTDIGFAKTLTSPHPEGEWQSGFYEWEVNSVDPWGHVVGTGIKAFPVFPHMELTGVMQVLA